MIRQSVLSVRQHGTTSVELVANLTLNDRCDRCGAEAKAVVLLKAPENVDITEPVFGNVLLFCGHHTNQYEPALVGQGASIYRKEEK